LKDEIIKKVLIKKLAKANKINNEKNEDKSKLSGKKK
jgi:hypothetical protein